MKNREKYYLIGVFVFVFAFAIGISIGFYLQSEKEIKPLIDNDFDFSESELKKSVVLIPGVDNRGRGVSAVLETNIREGSGFTLVNINDLTAGSSTQDSARIAVRAAKSYLDLSDEINIDVIYNIKTDAVFIDGPSAGAAMAISLISLIENKELDDKVSITGFVDEKLVIGPASGIEQKASALKEEGIEVFLVSDQIALPRDYIRKESCGFLNGKEYCEVNYVAGEEIEISGIRIVPVGSLEEAMKYFYKE